MKKLLSILILVLTVSSMMGQTPEKMSYQAVIRDAGDMLLTSTTVGMQISILEGSPTGTAVYVETHMPTTNANGLVSLVIGDGTIVSGVFSSIDWEGDSHFLKTETDPSGGTAYSIEGTAQLLSAPYALLSKDTENKNTLDQAYDEGGAGLGRFITADAGNIEITADGDWGLEIIADSDWTGLGVSGTTDAAHASIYAGASGDAQSFWGDHAGDGAAFYGFHSGAGYLGFFEHAGMGPGLDVLLADPTNPFIALRASTAGLGRVAFFNTDDNNANVSPTMAVINNAAGPAAEFIIVDEAAGKVNSDPAVLINTNGKGPGIFAHSMNIAGGGDANTEPVFFGKHDGYGSGAFLETSKTDNTSSTLEIMNNGAGHGAHIDSFGNPGVNVETTLYVEQGNSSTVAALGRTAVFDLHPAGTSADAAVLIRSGATTGGHSALRVMAASPAFKAAVFSGDVDITSDLVVGGSFSAAAKAFKIDHPLDPENKFLIHNSIESDERINIYSGNIITNMEGYATVQLPEYMNALNKDFKYQLTIVDKSFAQAIIWEPMNIGNNSFVIKTNAPEIQVSWQITGTRQDTWAKENPMQVEVNKDTGL
jgi:hypothetical protein